MKKITTFEEENQKSKRKKLIIILILLIILLLIITTAILMSNRKKDVKTYGKADYDDKKDITNSVVESKKPEKDIDLIKKENTNKVEDIVVQDKIVSSNTVKKPKQTSSVVGSNNNSGSSEALDATINNQETPNNQEINTPNKPNNPEKPDDSGESEGGETKPPVEEPKTTASIVSAEVQNYYVKKGENVNIKFTFESNSKKDITGVNVDNVFYPAIKNEDNTYTVSIPVTASNFGINKYSVTVAMFGNETVNLEMTKAAEYYVLKEEPKISDYKFNEFSANQTIKFNFINEDEALLDNAVFVIKDSEGNEVLTKKIVAGENKIELNELKNGKYTVSLKGTYDLDEDKDNNENTYDLSDIFKNQEGQEINVISDYELNVKIEDVKVDSENQKVVITLDSTNYANYKTEYVTIDGKEYKASLVNGKYIVEIPFENEENKEYHMTSVKLENDIELELEKELSFEVFKKKPSVEIKTKVSSDLKTISAEFTLTDKDKTVTALYSKLLDKDGNLVKEVQLEKSATSVEFKSENIFKAGKYTIEISSDYDIADGKEHRKESIGSKEVEVAIKAEIKSAKLDTEFSNKENEVKITYEITSNTDEELTNIIVNNQKLPVKKVKENTYEVNYKVKNSYGIEELISKELVYSDVVEVKENTTEIYVLKSEPTILNYRFDDKTEPATITFEVVDNDNSIIDGAKVVIVDKDTGLKILEEELKAGKNTIELTELEKLENDTYSLKVEGKYDLDEDYSEGKNEYDLSKVFEEKEIKFISDYKLEFKITKVEVQKDNSKVKVTFESKNEGNYPVTSVEINGKEYPVENDGEESYILFDYNKEENQKLTVSNVILSNGVELEVTDEANFEIFKEAPTVTEFTTEVDENTVTAKFKLEDKAGIMKNSKALLVNSNGDVVQEKEINKDTTEVVFDNIEKAGSYTVRIVADFDRVDGEEHKEEMLADISATIKITSEIKNSTGPEFAEKSKEIEVIYEIEDNTVDEILSLKVNGTDYTVTKTEDGKYKIKYTVGNTSGDETLNVTNIQYSGENVEVEYSSKVEVLKDKLSINYFNIDLTNEPTISFDMIDDDSSFESGKIIVTNTKDNSKQEISLEKNVYEYKVNLNEFDIYNIEIEITYDLDNNSENNLNNKTEIFDKLEKIEYIKDYKLSLTDFEVVDIDRDVNYSVKLQFKSTNLSIYDVDSVVIDGIENEVQKVEGLEDTYTFEYPFFEEGLDVRKEIIITDVILENNVDVEVENEAKVIIFKDNPIVDNVKLTTSEENDKIKATFDVTDNDSVLENIIVVLKDENNNVIEEKQLSPTEKEVEFDVLKSGKYKVEIEASYDRTDGLTHEKEYITESEDLVEIVSKALVTTESISDKYPTKGETIEIKYTIKSNTSLTPTKVVLNNDKEYPLTYESATNTYKITYTAPNEATILNLEVTKVFFENDVYVENPASSVDVLEVLKDTPTIDVTSTEAPEQKMIIFNVNVSDKDDAMLSGKATFHETDYELHKGSNTICLTDIELDEEHTITFEVKYDLDYNTITSGTEENDNTGTVTESKNFKIISDYELEINKIGIFRPDNNEELKYFEKNEKVQLRFSSKNKTELSPDKVTIVDLNSSDKDGIEYQVSKLENNSEYNYYVDLNTKGEYGTQEFKISAVRLSSSSVIPESKFKGDNPTDKIEVLKTKPTMTDYTSSNKENVLTVKFYVTDEDSALTDKSVIKVINLTDNKVVTEIKLQKGENVNEIKDLVPGVKYSIVVVNDYILSEDKEITGNEVFNEETIEITKKEESNFKVKNLTISKRVPINTDVHISFENSLMSYEDVDTVVIDNESYTVEKGNDNIYRVDVKPKEVGLNSIRFDTAKIGDKTFNVDRNLSYIYEKAVPTAEDVSDIIENTSTGEAEVTFKLVDKDSSIKSFTVYMKNSSGSIAATKEIKLEDLVTDENNVSMVSMTLLKMNSYSIELRAMCDVGDGKTFEEKTLFVKEKEYTEPRVTILTQSIDKEYVYKGETVVLTYKINTNDNREVKKIYIGDQSYNVKKVTDKDGKIIEDTYTIEVTAPKESGVFKQKVTKVQIGPNLVTAEYPKNAELIPIKVFKGVPTLTHFIVDEKNKNVTFKLNDTDKALVEPNPDFVITDEKDNQVYSGKLTNGGGDYNFSLDTIKMNSVGKSYNIAVDVTYDLRPDSNNIELKLMNFLTVSNTETEEEEETPTENYIITENIFKEKVKITGNIEYKLKFEPSEGYMLSMSSDQSFFFDCSTGTEYKVVKVIIDGEEYPVKIIKDKGEGNYYYEGSYRAKNFDQEYITFEKVILDNGAALDITDGKVQCWIQQSDPSFDITDFIEDTNEGIVRFNYKLTDTDMKLYSNLTFTLMDSQGNTIGTQVLDRESNSVEFNIPNPPTSVYRLKVTGKTYIFPGYTDYLFDWVAHDEEYQSSVNTSILRSIISNKYPKKGETITIDYGISSTKVVLVDKEDHSNQDKAVSIVALTINGKDYDVQSLEEKEQYRIYYTAPEEDGIQTLQVTHVKFSNGDVEEFVKEDQIEVLKDAPKIENFKTENKIGDGKIKFTFDIEDGDNVLSSDSIYASLGNNKHTLTSGHNEFEFSIDLDKFEKFEIKATYDLDTNTLQNEDGNSDDNYYNDYTIFEKQVILTGDYGITFSNIKTFNTKNENTEYFEKNEEIKVTFECKTKFEELYPETIVIDSVPYKLEKVSDQENTYTILLPSKDIAGKITSKIESVTLNSGNEVVVLDQNASYEILKDVVKVKSLTHYIPENADKINLVIEIEDKDSANKETRIEIQDEYEHKISLDSNVLEAGINNISFTKTEAEKYFVSIVSTYNRDVDDKDKINLIENERIHYQIVSTTTRHIEMKDIVDIKLFILDEYDVAKKIDVLSNVIAEDMAGNEENLDNYLVEVSMKNISKFYSKITKATLGDGKLKLELAYTDAMVVTEAGELKPLEVTLDMLESGEGYEYKGSFKSLVDRMKLHPTDTIKLDKDYDLYDYLLQENQKAIIDFDFKGKIDGNGHTITNLTKPLFSKLDGATVENLVLKGIVFTGGESKGVIAVTATNGTTISNVHVENLVSPGNSTACFVYELNNKSTVEKCSGTNLTYNTSYVSQSISAGIITMRNGSKIDNCYVQGTIPTCWWNNAGLVVQTDSTCVISNNIVNMKMASNYGFNEGYGYGNGGIVSADVNNGKQTDGLNLQNNLSLVEGNKGVGAIYNIKSTKLSSESKNNYQLDTAIVQNTEELGKVKTISKKDINSNFFKNELKLDSSIWTIDKNASITNLPVLKGVSNSYNDNGKQPNNTEVYIPDYNRVSGLESYQEDREIAYHNMYKLMPFYDAKEIIRDGNKVPKENELYTKIIRYIVPFNKEGKMVSNLTTENYNSLTKIYIVFEDNTKLVYDIAFDDYYGNVASYMITDLNIGYNYNRYIIDPNQEIIQRLVNMASSYEFRRDLDPLTTGIEEDSRLYEEHFNNYTKNHIKDFVINLLINMGYSPNFESDILNKIIEQRLIGDDIAGHSDKLKVMLFAYNYFTYWYNLDMDGINLADSVMFHSTEMFDKDMTFEYLANYLIQGTNSATNGIAGFYNNYFVKYTKLSNLGYYLDYYVTTLTHYKEGIEWFKANFKGGYYYDVTVEKSKEKGDLYYTLWDHLKKDGKVQNNFLPLMTVPENSMYVMSSPSQAYFGSLRVYMTDPNDQAQIDKFKAKVEVWLKEVQSFYTFAYDFWGPDNINKYCDTNYDMRTTYTGVGTATVYNNPLTTEEPYHKYFLEAVGRWPAQHGGAYANGNEVFWAVIKMLDNFRVGTHETLHNQDSKIFLNGYGRRGGAEDYAAGFIQQYYREGWVSPNIFDEGGISENENTTQNLYKSTVETPEKLHAYYDKYFRVNDFLDYVEAQAYFKLTDEQKASISVQVSYPEVTDQDAGDDVVAYTPLTTDAVTKMDLKDMASLWDNRIMLRPGVKEYERRSPGADTDSIFNIHWYQPHADNDRPDGANFKYLAWQMAGERGYYDGLVAYYSGSYLASKTGEKTTDLTALRYIMEDQTMTFRRYKLERYEKLSKYFYLKGTYIDAQTIYNDYLNALTIDAKNKDRNLSQSKAVKKKYFQQLRKNTKDFTIEPFEGEIVKLVTIDLDSSEVKIENNKSKELNNNVVTSNSVGNTVVNNTVENIIYFENTTTTENVIENNENTVNSENTISNNTTVSNEALVEEKRQEEISNNTVQNSVVETTE